MRRLIALAADLIDHAQGMGVGVDGKTADRTDRIGLARPILVDREQMPAIARQGQPRRVGTFDHLPGLAGNLAAGAVKAIAIYTFAAALCVGAHQQVVLSRCSGLGKQAQHSGKRKWHD
ncbi:hypothetical protein D3C81_1589710 [compost metagenome]